ncbi:unnamed protein product [Alopecurus aequalis]
MKRSERIVFGGATVHAARSYAAGEEGVMAQGRPLPVSSKGYLAREFMQESGRAKERQLPVISSKALAPHKCSFIKTGHLLVQSTRCQLPVIFLFAIALSASFVCSEAADPNSEEGNCQYNLIGLAVLSCQHHKDPFGLPSTSCCNYLLHAVDEIPPVGESGDCCLCRYTKNRLLTPALATSYISCYGKDRANVAKWTYPIETCDKACNKTNILPGMSTPAEKNPQDGHGSRNTKILSVAVLLFLILLVSSVCFCWVRPKRGSHQTEIRRFSSPGQPKGRVRRRSLPNV